MCLQGSNYHKRKREEAKPAVAPQSFVAQALKGYSLEDGPEEPVQRPAGLDARPGRIDRRSNTIGATAHHHLMQVKQQKPRQEAPVPQKRQERQQEPQGHASGES